MKVTKLGHCCLVIELKGKRLLTDPGSYTVEEQTKLEGMDAILYTHEHGDHFHLESLKEILKNNPDIHIYANSSVSDLLNQENITHQLINNADRVNIGDIAIQGIGELHAQFHSTIPASPNLGFLIDRRFWYPGDAFTDPGVEVEILALPVAGPWMKIGEAIDYALKLKPKIAFPVHDGQRYAATHKFPSEVLPKHGIEFIPMVEGDSQEF